MILPGTLVQYVAGLNPRLRQHGVYTVKTSRIIRPEFHCPVCDKIGCGQTGLLLCEVDAIPEGELVWNGLRSIGFFSSCGFRIIAPPITEADRLEASAPDAPAKPKRVRA